MVEEITRLWEGLSLTEEEKQEIIPPKEAVINSETKGQHCPLALIINYKTVNKEAFRSTLAKFWSSDGWLTFREVGENRFLVEFQNLSDKEKVMHERPWSFDRHIVNLQDFEGSLSRKEVQFKYESFLMQLHNLPFVAMTEEMGKHIGFGMGKVLKVEVD